MISFSTVKSLNGEITVPSDKSISHRSFMLSAMAEGRSKIINPLMSRDTIATKNAMEMLGVSFKSIENGFEVDSKGYENFIEADNIIDCDNSGTTARLVTGILAPQKKYFVLTGDNSLRKRPMDRVRDPLSLMGSKILLRKDRYMPLVVLPSDMKSTHIVGKVKSAQVKSAVILSALQIEGETTYLEESRTRNHTELMLKQYGVTVQECEGKVIVQGKCRLKGSDVTVPGDFSSSAFFIGAALMFPNSEILIKSVGLNPTRTGLLSVLDDFGVKYSVEIKENIGEPIGNIYIKSQSFSGTVIKGDIIPNIIDEIPMIATLGLFADSPVEIREAEELRVKESDRISAVVNNLKELGAEVEEYEDGLKVYPLKKLNISANLKSYHDHRIAMINILLAKRFSNKIKIDDISAVDVSFPDFLEKVESLESSVA